MTTTQIIIAVCGFAVLLAISLIGYIWADAKKSIQNAVSEKSCEERREKEKEYVDSINKKLCHHEHSEDGKVKVEL